MLEIQALGVAFGILAFDNVDIFIAYLIMGAEGYFTLVSRGYREKLPSLRITGLLTGTPRPLQRTSSSNHGRSTIGVTAG